MSGMIEARRDKAGGMERERCDAPATAQRPIAQEKRQDRAAAVEGLELDRGLKGVGQRI